MIPSHSVHQWSDTTAVCSVRIIAASAKGMIQNQLLSQIHVQHLLFMAEKYVASKDFSLKFLAANSLIG